MNKRSFLKMLLMLQAHNYNHCISAETLSENIELNTKDVMLHTIKRFHSHVKILAKGNVLHH